MDTSDDLLEFIDLSDVDSEDGNCHPSVNLARSGTSRTQLTNTEEQIFDRQIRLWGIEAQERIMSSRVLFLGKNGIQEEAIKNLLLAGMNVSIVNDHAVSEEDVKLSFFLMNEDIGKSHAESLAHRMSQMISNNERVKGLKSEYLVDTDGMYNVIDLDTFCKFNVVCLATEDYLFHKLMSLNEVCRKNGIGFYTTLCNGTCGYIFLDLNVHTVAEKLNKNLRSCTIEYRTIEQILNAPKIPKDCDDMVRDMYGLILLLRSHPNIVMLDDCSPEIIETLENICKKIEASPENVLMKLQMYRKGFPITASILGGYLSLEVRKFVTKQHETIPNFCVFDMNRSCVATAMI